MQTHAVASIEAPSSGSGPSSSAEQDEYADRIDELLDNKFASDRRGDEVTDEEFAEALRWVLEGPRLTTGELLAFLDRTKRL